MSNSDTKSTKSTSQTPSSIFCRSLTIHHTADFPSKPCPNPSLDRKGSVKNPSFDPAKGKVKNLCALFESAKPRRVEKQQSKLDCAKPCLESQQKPSKAVDSLVELRGTEDRVVVYFTSLRGVRRTFEDCYAVRMILRGYRVNVDERDVSMDSAYRKELQNVLGLKTVVLPQVFIRGRYIGGAEVVKQLNEVGELGKMIKGLATRAPGYVCRMCGDVRFVPCENCSGSRKVFDEDEERLKRCAECNENGLVRCPACCS